MVCSLCCPKVVLFRVFFFCIGACRQWAPPPITCLLGPNYLSRLYLASLGRSLLYLQFSIVCLYAFPKSSLFRVSFCCIRAIRQWAPPLSFFCSAQTASVDFTWILLSAAYFTSMSSWFVCCASLESQFFGGFVCCIRAGRQWAPPISNCCMAQTISVDFT